MDCIITNYNVTPTTNSPFPCNSVVGSDNLLGGGIAYVAYGYLLNAPSVYVFVVLFGILLLLHLSASAYYRVLWTVFTLGAGATLELLGWAGRLWSLRTTHWDPNQGGQWDNNSSGFTMEICCLIIGPTFFSAANYLLLSAMIKKTGDQYCMLSARSFSVLFTMADVVCLVVQGLGGGMVGSTNTNSGTKNGLHVMAVGVLLQMALMTVFSGFFIEFVVRYVKSSPARRQVDLLKPFNRLRAPFTKRRSTTKSTRSKTAMVETKGPQPLSTPDSETTVDVEANRFARSAPETEISDKRVRWMMASLTSSTLLLFVRGVYRCDELLDFTGLNSGAYANQNLFIGMDATLMTVLLVIQLVLHPGLVAGRRHA